MKEHLYFRREFHLKRIPILLGLRGISSRFHRLSFLLLPPKGLIEKLNNLNYTKSQIYLYIIDEEIRQDRNF